MHTEETISLVVHTIRSIRTIRSICIITSLCNTKLFYYLLYTNRKLLHTLQDINSKGDRLGSTYEEELKGKLHQALESKKKLVLFAKKTKKRF